MTSTLSHRAFVQALAGTAAVAARAGDSRDLVAGIERQMIWNGRDGGGMNGFVGAGPRPQAGDWSLLGLQGPMR
jgi:hypothetical protein